MKHNVNTLATLQISHVYIVYSSTHSMSTLSVCTTRAPCTYQQSQVQGKQCSVQQQIQAGAYCHSVKATYGCTRRYHSLVEHQALWTLCKVVDTAFIITAVLSNSKSISCMQGIHSSQDQKEGSNLINYWSLYTVPFRLACCSKASCTSDEL